MKSYKIILIIIAAIILGFVAGFWRFAEHSESRQMETAQKEHDHSQATIWTCSMHPQIRQDEPGKCPICGMDLIPLQQAQQGRGSGLEMTPEAAKLAQVETMTVGLSEDKGNTRRTLTGKLQADERRASSQVSHIAGRIEQLFVTFTGESVSAGQKLATIYSPELVTAQRELIEATKLKESRPQLLEAARKKLGYWKIPEKVIDEIENSGQVQPNITVVAEHSGVVMERYVSVGDYVREGEPLFDIVNLNTLWVLLDAYEEDLATIRVGDKVNFSVASVPGQDFSPKVSFIDPVIDARTRVASVRAEVPNTRGVLKPEMLVRAVIESNHRGGKAAITVPKSAVLWTGTRSVVYVQDTTSSVPSYLFREVTISESGGDSYTVIEGLRAAERVVVNGAFVIDAAAQLNNMSSMMNRRVSISGVEKTTPGFTNTTPAGFRKELNEITLAYLDLKDALVNTDPKRASEMAREMTNKLKKVPMELLKGDAHYFWMEQSEAVRSHAENLADAHDVEEQRQEFSYLSMALVEIVRAFGSGSDTLFVQFCPMAFDNSGGQWISAESEIRNPYFGDKMLKCGSVTETITPELDSDMRNHDEIHQH